MRALMVASAGKEVGSWHVSDVPILPTKVGYQG